MHQRYKTAAEHGRHVFVYGHLRTKQTVYSLMRALNPNHARSQLPFLGKRTQPSKFRKDFWRPLATVTFPSARQGLSAYQKLREFKVRHEHEWNGVDTSKKNSISRKKDIARQLMAQKANSIADLAAVLRSQERDAKLGEQTAEKEHEMAESKDREAKERLEEIKIRKAELRPRIKESEEARKEYKELKNEKMKIQKMLKKPVPWKALQGEHDPLNDETPPAKRGLGRRRGIKAIPRVTMDGICIEWAEMQDAEFAQSWPKSVVHDKMRLGGKATRHSAPAPTPTHEEPPQLEAVKTEEQERLEHVQPKKPAMLPQPDQEKKPSQTALERLVVRLRDGAQ